MQRAVLREERRDTDDLLAERGELLLDRAVADGPVRVEHASCGRNWHDIWHRPTAQGPDREFHRVDRLQPLRASGGAHQPDHLVVRSVFETALAAPSSARTNAVQLRGTLAIELPRPTS